MPKSVKSNPLIEPIEAQAKAALDSQIEQLDENVERQLAQIRQQALAQGNKKSGQPWFKGALIASACSAVLVAVVFFQMQPSAPSQQTVTEMIALHDMNEDPELLNDMEFIYWLSEHEKNVLL